MLTVGRGQSRTCSGVTRRDFLRVGGLGLGSWGLSLTGLNAQAAVQSKPERSVILLLDGCAEPKAGRLAAPFKGRRADGLDRVEVDRLLAEARTLARAVASGVSPDRSAVRQPPPGTSTTTGALLVAAGR